MCTLRVHPCIRRLYLSSDSSFLAWTPGVLTYREKVCPANLI